MKARKSNRLIPTDLYTQVLPSIIYCTVKYELVFPNMSDYKNYLDKIVIPQIYPSTSEPPFLVQDGTWTSF